MKIELARSLLAPNLKIINKNLLTSCLFFARVCECWLRMPLE